MLTAVNNKLSAIGYLKNFAKISAFGGDYLFVDRVYGHLVMAKENIAIALSIKVKEGLFDIGKAKEIAGMLFYDNPVRIFKL
jgi:hypothetical protein